MYIDENTFVMFITNRLNAISDLTPFSSKPWTDCLHLQGNEAES